MGRGCRVRLFLVRASKRQHRVTQHRRLKLPKLNLGDLAIHPRRIRQKCCVFTPDCCRAILMRHIDVFLALRLEGCKEKMKIAPRSLA